MEIEREGYWEPNWTKPLMKMLTDWCTEGSRNYRQTACRMECRTTLPEAYQMTTKKPTDILPKLPTEMATEKLTKNAPKLKKDSLQTKLKPNRIMCRITERLQLQSRIPITLLPSYHRNRQSIYI